MIRSNCCPCIAAVLVALAGSVALGQPGSTKPTPPPATPTTTHTPPMTKPDMTKPDMNKPDMNKPGDHGKPGAGAGMEDMSPEDMKACMEAATPGPMHAFLGKGVGTWSGKSTMWMSPGAEGMKSDCTSTVTAVMDGRFIKCEMAGEMPGMGAFTGYGMSGFDNVSQKFQSTWVDNMGTGMMMGTGELSSDQKTMTWNYTVSCPITKKPTTMREVQHFNGPDAMTMEMFGADPKSGKEYKVMEIAFTRKGGMGAKPSANATPSEK